MENTTMNAPGADPLAAALSFHEDLTIFARKSTVKPTLVTIPTELLLDIVDLLDGVNDISALSRVNSKFHWMCFDRVFDAGLQARIDHRYSVPENAYSDLFYHAVRFDSVDIIRYMISKASTFDLTTIIPEPLLDKFTFFHLALVADAPKVAARLRKHGAKARVTVGPGYPDLTPLARSIAGWPQDINKALRIACSIGLPRVVRALLEQGADANTASDYGEPALHAALAKRVPWHRPAKFLLVKLLILDGYDGGEETEERIWRSKVVQTAAALVEFGADPAVRDQKSRVHWCTHKCWRSVDCNHPGQTALHLAASAGNLEALELLVGKGADPSAANGGGYTPLYSAISQGHLQASEFLLSSSSQEEPRAANPRVNEDEGTTALHAACRFAFPRLVEVLLERAGADPNVLDNRGLTPVHELLGQARIDGEEDVLKTLTLLSGAGADPSFSTDPVDPRELAKGHTFQCVRDVFEPARGSITYEELEATDALYNAPRPTWQPSPWPSNRPPEQPEYAWGEARRRGDEDVHYPVLGQEPPKPPQPPRQGKERRKGKGEEEGRRRQSKPPTVASSTAPRPTSYTWRTTEDWVLQQQQQQQANAASAAGASASTSTSTSAAPPQDHRRASGPQTSQQPPPLIDLDDDEDQAALSQDQGQKGRSSKPPAVPAVPQTRGQAVAQASAQAWQTFSTKNRPSGLGGVGATTSPTPSAAYGGSGRGGGSYATAAAAAAPPASRPNNNNNNNNNNEATQTQQGGEQGGGAGRGRGRGRGKPRYVPLPL